MTGRESLCADVRCEHPKGWHRHGQGSCLECGCTEFKAPQPSLFPLFSHLRTRGGSA